MAARLVVVHLTVALAARWTLRGSTMLAASPLALPVSATSTQAAKTGDLSELARATAETDRLMNEARRAGTTVGDLVQRIAGQQSHVRGIESDNERLLRDRQERADSWKQRAQEASSAVSGKFGELSSEINRLLDEKRRALEEIRDGLFCSDCCRPPVQILREENETFETHLGQAVGRHAITTAERATNENCMDESDVLQDCEVDYDREIAALKRQREALADQARTYSDLAEQARNDHADQLTANHERLSQVRAQQSSQQSELNRQIDELSRLAAMHAASVTREKYMRENDLRALSAADRSLSESLGQLAIEIAREREALAQRRAEFDAEEEAERDLTIDEVMQRADRLASFMREENQLNSKSAEVDRQRRTLETLGGTRTNDANARDAVVAAQLEEVRAILLKHRLSPVAPVSIDNLPSLDGTQIGPRFSVADSPEVRERNQLAERLSAIADGMSDARAAAGADSSLPTVFASWDVDRGLLSYVNHVLDGSEDSITHRVVGDYVHDWISSRVESWTVDQLLLKTSGRTYDQLSDAEQIELDIQRMFARVIPDNANPLDLRSRASWVHDSGQVLDRAISHLIEEPPDGKSP